MSPIDFVHEIEINVSRDRLRAFLCDLHNYIPLHPLIESIEEITPLAEMPRARRYRVVDRIPIGPFRLRTVYTAALEAVTEREVHGYARQSPGVRLHTVYAPVEPVGLAAMRSAQLHLEEAELVASCVDVDCGE